MRAALLPLLLLPILAAQDPEAWKPRPGAPTLELTAPALRVAPGRTLRLAAKGTYKGPLTWGCSAGQIDSEGRFTAPTTSGPVFVSVQSPTDPRTAARLRLDVVREAGSAPAAELRPARIALLPGQAFTFMAVAEGIRDAVAWEASRGSFHGSTFVAPTEPGPLQVTARWGALKATAEVTVAKPAPKRIVAYALGPWLADRGLDPAKVDVRGVTHLNVAFAVLRDGQLAMADPAKDPGRWAAFRALRDRNPGMKLLLSVGGWGALGFHGMAASPEGRARFATSAVELLAREGFDGLDLDWEYPCYDAFEGTPADGEAFSSLVQDLRRTFDAHAVKGGRPLLLTAATAGGPDQFAFYDWATAAPALDFLNLMTYDLHGPYEPFTGFHASLFPVREEGRGLRTLAVVATVEAYLRAGVPRDKLVVGLPFYGKAYRLAPGTAPGPGVPSLGSASAPLAFRDLDRSFTPSQGWTRRRHLESQQLELVNREKGIWANVDDAETIRAKAAYILAEELGGAMFWELTQDDGRLMEALRRALQPQK